MKKQWEDDTKLMQSIRDSTVVCECGCRTTINKDYAICRYCGKKIYTKKDDFKNKIKKLLEAKC